jgi:hypothetical protein
MFQIKSTKIEKTKVVRLEGFKGYTKIIDEKGTVIISGYNIGKIESEFPNFIKINRSLLTKRTEILSFYENKIEVKGLGIVVIPRRKINTLKEKLA